MSGNPLDFGGHAALATGGARNGPVHEEHEGGRRIRAMVRYASATALATLVALVSWWPTTFAGQRAEKSAMSNRISVRVGDKAFTATLVDNATAAALRARLPLAVTMTELNGNEKFVRLPGTLPTQETTPSTIQTGDVMLYGSNTLVLFYKSFPTSYSYTRIGRVDDPTGLDAALGGGDVGVVFTAVPPRP